MRHGRCGDRWLAWLVVSARMHLTWHVRFWRKKAHLRDHAAQIIRLHYLQWRFCGKLLEQASDEFRVYKWLWSDWSVQDECTCGSVETLLAEDLRCSTKQPGKEELGLEVGAAFTHPQRGRRKVPGHGSYSMDYQYHGTTCGTAYVDTDMDDASERSEGSLSIYV